MSVFLAAALASTFAWVATSAPGSADASTITTGVIEARMSNHIGVDADGDPDGSDSSNCVRYAPSDGPDSSGWVSMTSSPSEAQTAHGRDSGSCPSKLDIKEQSAVGIRPAAGGTVNDGSSFLLGRVVHYNNPIRSAAEYWKGVMSFRMDGFDSAPTVNFDWWMWETPNDANPCPDGGNDNGCFDEIKFNSEMADALVSQKGIDYRLVIDGFKTVGPTAECPASPAGATSDIFWTPEEETSHACLYATLSEVRRVTVVKSIDGATGSIVAPSASFVFDTASTVGGSPWHDSDFTLTPAADGSAQTKSKEISRTEVVTIDERTPADARWSLASIACTEFDANGATRPLASAVYDLAKGVVTLVNVPAPVNMAKPDITCEFKNIYTPMATLTLVKSVSSGTALPADFTLTATGESTAPVSGRVVTGKSGSSAVTSVMVPAGAYTLSETGPVGYLSDKGWSCTGTTVTSGKVTLADGATTTCSIANRYSTGSLSIKVVVSDPSSGLTNPTKSFTGTYKCGDAAAAAFVATVATPFTVSGLPTGVSCTVVETAPTGDLLNSSYAWGTPTYATLPAVIGDGTTNTVTITNPVVFTAPTTTIAPTTTVAGTVGGLVTGPEQLAADALPTTGAPAVVPMVVFAVALMLLGLGAMATRRGATRREGDQLHN